MTTTTTATTAMIRFHVTLGDNFEEFVNASSPEEAADKVAKMAGHGSAAGLAKWSLENHGEEWSFEVRPAKQFQLQVRGEWAGVTGSWRPAIDGTINQTGKTAFEASTFDSEREAEEAFDLCEGEGADHNDLRVVEL